MDEAGLEGILRLIITGVLTVAGPLITGFVKDWPVWARYLIAAFGTMLVGAMAGAIPGSPITPVAGAETGLAAGPLAQAILRGLMTVNGSVSKP